MTNLPIGKLSLTLGGILLLIPPSFAQTNPPPRTSGVPDGGTREVLVSIFIPATPGQPFTATVNTETIRYLGDGSRITLVNHRLIARDKGGRIFQQRRLLVPPGAEENSFVTQTEITDPHTREQYICQPRNLVCQWELLSAIAPVFTTVKNADSPEQVPLGTRMMSGVETVGTRETQTIPAGTIGNSSPLLTKREYWYSPRLEVNLLSIREDPRFGSQRFELTDVELGDPDAKLFAPPEGSQIIDLRSTTAVPARGLAAPKPQQ